MKYLRGINYVHRDLKPENILLLKTDLLSPDQTQEIEGYSAEFPYIVKLADFGFVRQLSEEESNGTFLGTKGYVCPEILQFKKYGPKCDLWSLGVILFVMVCQK